MALNSLLCADVPLTNCSINQSISSSSDTVSTCAGTDIGNVACYSQMVQSKNVADDSLIDLLNMSDDDIDVLLSGFVDHLSDDQLSCNAGTCLAASTNANACHVDIPVCCSDIASVTEVFDCYHQKMESSYFYMAEETFQPDYFELPDVPATGEPASISGKRVTNCLLMSPVSGSSVVLPVTVAVEAAEAAVALPSLKQTQPVVSEPQSEPPASDPILMSVDEVLEGVG